MQQIKSSLGVFVPPRISVASRDYFAHWQVTPPERAVVRRIDPIADDGKTRGRGVEAGDEPGIPGGGPLGSAVPFPASIRVSIPGFSFAIVNRQGDLLFHSEAEHDASENFFAETDNNRRLRALIDARQRGWLNLQYGGDEYRAYARPMAIPDVPDWSLITFFDKQLARTLNIDWLILTSLFVGIYAGVYLAIIVAIHFTRPTYRAPWIWPSSDRSHTYIQIAIVLTVLIGGWLAGFRRLSNAELLWTAWLLPFVAWIITYCLLAPPEAAHRRTVVAAIGVAILSLLGGGRRP